MVGSPDLKIARHELSHLLLAAACLGACAGGAFAQDTSIDQDTLRGVGLVAVITGQIGETPVFGAGIVFAREKDRLYITTANHVVRQGGKEAGNLQIKLRNWPNKLLVARLLPQAERELDVAALTVENLAANGVDPCTLSLDRLAPSDALKRGTGVLPVGNPNGVPWGVPVRMDDILEVRGNQVIFESTRIARGHSGGALLGEGGQVIGMIQADEPPNGRALGMQGLIRVLETWNLPVHLRLPAEDGVSPLIGAVRNHDVEDVRSLLGQACTNVNSTESGDSLTVLGEAAVGGEIAIVNLLLQAGAEVNPRTARSPLELAAGKGNLEVVHALIARGAEVNSSRSNQNALVAAADRGHLEIVKFLLANGADPNLTGYRSRRTALLAALRPTASPRRPAHDEILRALIQAGADVNWKDDSGNTPLSMAVDGRQVGAVRILLAAGANAAVRDRNGYSPLRLVTNQFYQPEEPLLQQIAVSLLQSSSEIDAEDAGRLLNRCAQEGWADVASLVVQRGFNVKGDVGDKTLQDAAKSGYPNVMRVLLEAGAGPDANDPNTQTPLQLALGTVDSARIDPNTRLEMVELLVSKGAKVNLKLNPYLSSQQPIGIAVTYLPGENLKIVEFLLAHGAVVTPDLIDLARLKNPPDVVALLLKAQRPAVPAKK